MWINVAVGRTLAFGSFRFSKGLLIYDLTIFSCEIRSFKAAAKIRLFFGMLLVLKNKKEPDVKSVEALPAWDF